MLDDATVKDTMIFSELKIWSRNIGLSGKQEWREKASLKNIVKKASGTQSYNTLNCALELLWQGGQSPTKLLPVTKLQKQKDSGTTK